MTATPDKDNEGKLSLYKKYCPILFEYYNSAKDGIINKRKHLVLSYDLVGTELLEYLNIERTYSNCLEALSEISKDPFNDAAKWAWRGQGTKEEKNIAFPYLNITKKRKKFLNTLKSASLNAIKIKKAILEKQETNKVLLFSTLIQQVMTITDELIHSKNKKQDNDKALEMFNNGEIRELGSVKSLTLGLNLKAANNIVIESFDSSKVAATQKMGRSDRLDISETATVIWIVPKNTQSQKWFSRAMGYKKTNIETFNNAADLILNL